MTFQTSRHPIRLCPFRKRVYSKAHHFSEKNFIYFTCLFSEKDCSLMHILLSLSHEFAWFNKISKTAVYWSKNNRTLRKLHKTRNKLEGNLCHLQDKKYYKIQNWKKKLHSQTTPSSVCVVDTVPLSINFCRKYYWIWQSDPIPDYMYKSCEKF